MCNIRRFSKLYAIYEIQHKKNTPFLNQIYDLFEELKNQRKHITLTWELRVMKFQTKQQKKQ